MVEQTEALVKEILLIYTMILRDVIPLTLQVGILASNLANLLTPANACGIVMLAPKVWTAPSYSSAGSYVYVVAS